MGVLSHSIKRWSQTLAAALRGCTGPPWSCIPHHAIRWKRRADRPMVCMYAYSTILISSELLLQGNGQVGITPGSVKHLNPIWKGKKKTGERQ